MIKSFCTFFGTLTTAFVVSSSAFAAEAGQSGLPQLNADTYSSQIFWIIVSFLVLYFLMSNFALPKVSHVLEERHNTIQDNIEHAQKLQKEIDTLKDTYEKTLADAHSHATSVTQKMEQTAAKKAADKNSDFAKTAKARIEKAETAIQSARVETLKSLETIAAGITQDVLVKIANITVDEKTALKVVQQKMKDVAS